MWPSASNMLRWLLLLVLVVLFVCSYVPLLVPHQGQETYNDYERPCDMAMRSLISTLGTDTKYTELTQVKNGARIVDPSITHTKGVGVSSAHALAKSHAKVEQNNARTKQNREAIQSTRLNHDSLLTASSGKLVNPNSNTYSTATGTKTTDEKIRALQAQVDALTQRDTLPAGKG